MDIGVVRFPALIIADDGWVQLLDNAEALKRWKRSAIMKYKKQPPVLYDMTDHAWRVSDVVPEKPMTWMTRMFAQTFYDPKVAARLEVEPITESPLEAVRNVLARAIEADNDIVTQDCNATDLKEKIQKATSFETLVTELKRNHAI